MYVAVWVGPGEVAALAWNGSGYNATISAHLSDVTTFLIGVYNIDEVTVQQLSFVIGVTVSAASPQAPGHGDGTGIQLNVSSASQSGTQNGTSTK